MFLKRIKHIYFHTSARDCSEYNQPPVVVQATNNGLRCSAALINLFLLTKRPCAIARILPNSYNYLITYAAGARLTNFRILGEKSIRKHFQKVLIPFLLLSFFFSNKTIKAQDPHFSQYFSSPLTFNPAFTGYFDGIQRFTVNIRNQWANGGVTYTTGTTSFDTKILKNKIGNNDKWGFGVHALYDQSSGGIFKNSYLSLSTAFNKGLDADGDQSLGLGVQATMGQNTVDFNRISFSNQFNGSGFNLGLPSGETVFNRSISYIDLNAGILFNYKDQSGNQFSFGASMFHILRPKLSYFSGNNNSLQPRYSVHAGAGFAAGTHDNVFFSTHIMQQAGASEFVFGGAYGLGVGETDLSLYLGAWLRKGDALYPYLALQTSVYQLGLSYDITNADITRENKFSGSMELSFIYFFKGDRKKGIPCFF